MIRAHALKRALTMTSLGAMLGLAAAAAPLAAQIEPPYVNTGAFNLPVPQLPSMYDSGIDYRILTTQRVRTIVVRPIRNRPFIARFRVEYAENQGNGKVLRRESTLREERDSNGRLLFESRAPDPKLGEVVQTVVSDPKTNRTVAWNNMDEDAVEEHGYVMGETQGMGAYAVNALHVSPNQVFALPKERLAPVGETTVAGLPVAELALAPAAGRAASSTVSFWSSKELGIDLKWSSEGLREVSHGGRTGSAVVTQTVELVSLERTEPAAKDFERPASYTVRSAARSGR